jgi:putative DNA primase/helicase
MQEVFGPLTWLPTPDGAIHRFYVPGDKPGSQNGWYVLFLDGIPCGVFGNWKAGGSRKWRSEPTNHFESQLFAQHIQQAQRQREAEQRQRHQAAAEEANRLWSKARPATDNHAYLTRKQVKAHNLRQLGDVLLVPLTRYGLLVSLQCIYPDGKKRFLRGSMVKGACSLIGMPQPGQPLYICEGWATGATLHVATGATVACAMSADNLLEVGRRLLRQHPEAVLIVAGDDDRATPGNPGRTAATNAATTLGCGLIFPPWCGREPLDLTDFNDLANWRAAQ